jgi:thiol:disulfide interchange protein DsbD
MKKFVLLLVLFLSPWLSYANPPPAAVVFPLSAKLLDPNTFILNWHIKKGFFLYQERIKVEALPHANIEIGHLAFPEAQQQTNSQGKTYFVYRNDLILPVSVLGKEPGESLFTVHYQGCSDEGFCYPPQTQAIKLTIDNGLALNAVNLESAPLLPEPSLESENQTDKFERLFASNSLGLIMLSFFGFGLLLSFTPCVLPMVPVLSGIIVGHGKDLSSRKAFFLSLSYVLSMSLTYAAVGAVVALMGSNLQIAMQSPWIISLFSLLFVLLALSMFNFYELRLPVSWQSKLANVTRKQGSGHYLSAAIMGSLSTLILSPCVTAPLIGALGYIAQTGNISIGSLALFSLGIGMGTPLLLIGTSAGKLIPKAGRWMNVVKAFFGVLLLATAIYLMSRILPAPLTMSLWASLLIFSGSYMGAFNKALSKPEKFTQGLGIIFLVYGLLILIGASRGNTDPLQPLASTKMISPKEAHAMMTVKSIEEVQKALVNAKGKPVMLDFYADWCASCKVLAKTLLKDKLVTTALHRFVVLKVDLTPNNAETKALLNYYNVVAPPTFLFFNTEGKELDHLRLVGEIKAQTFYTSLHKTLGPVAPSSPPLLP